MKKNVDMKFQQIYLGGVKTRKRPRPPVQSGTERGLAVYGLNVPEMPRIVRSAGALLGVDTSRALLFLRPATSKNRRPTMENDHSLRIPIVNLKLRIVSAALTFGLGPCNPDELTKEEYGGLGCIVDDAIDELDRINNLIYPDPETKRDAKDGGA